MCMPTQSCLTLCDLIDGSCQPPLSVELSRQEYRSGLPFPTPGDLPNLEIDPGSSGRKEAKQTPCDVSTYLASITQATRSCYSLSPSIWSCVE